MTCLAKVAVDTTKDVLGQGRFIRKELESRKTLPFLLITSWDDLGDVVVNVKDDVDSRRNGGEQQTAALNGATEIRSWSTSSFILLSPNNRTRTSKRIELA